MCRNKESTEVKENLVEQKRIYSQLQIREAEVIILF